MILGSLLGDLNISKPKNGKSCKLTIVHCEKQKQLFFKKFKLLGEFRGKYKLYTILDKRTLKVYPQYRGNSKSHVEFNKIYDILYINGKKQITSGYLNLITSPIALAYWFMDDGTNRGTLATNCFSEQEVDLLIEWLFNKWNIIATKQKNLKNYVIHISNKSRLNFEKLIVDYMVPDMYYKLKYINQLNREVC